MAQNTQRRPSRQARRIVAGASLRHLKTEGRRGISLLESTEPILATGEWQVDPSHSAIEFRVRHMKIATVKAATGVHPDGSERLGLTNQKGLENDGKRQCTRFLGCI